MDDHFIQFLLFFLIYQKQSTHHTISRLSSFIHSSVEEAGIAIALSSPPNCHSGEMSGISVPSQATLVPRTRRPRISPQ